METDKISLDFTELTDEEVILNIKNIPEFEIYWDDYQEKRCLARKNRYIHKYQEGFAIVNLNDGILPELNFLYISPEFRRQGVGRKIMKDLIKNYCDTYYMTLLCDKKLTRFYNRFGFRVIKRDGDHRKMEGPKE